MVTRRILLAVGGLIAVAFTAAALWGPESEPAVAGGPIRYGDATCDGLVNAVDALFILQVDARLLGALPCPQNADVNRDGRADSLDALSILQYEAGIIPSLPITPGQPSPTPRRTPTPTRTRTPTPTRTRTPTATGTPASAGCTFNFAPFYAEPDTFCGSVTEIRSMTTIPGNDFHEPVDAPAGTEFAVVFMTVTNFGSAPDHVGILALRLRDSQGGIFTMEMGLPDLFTAQIVAEEHFDLQGPGDTLGPGTTHDMVFVFLVPTDAAGLVVERCPTDGCSP